MGCLKRDMPTACHLMVAAAAASMLMWQQLLVTLTIQVALWPAEEDCIV
jgi:hypothetical protein